MNSTFLGFLPVTFLTTVFVPEEALTGWMAHIVQFNPVTYLLEGMRSLVSDGWEGRALLKGFGGIAAFGVITIALALWSLAGRVSRR